MSEKRKKKLRKKKMRSYRKLMQFLWAFGLAGLGLGSILVIWFGLHHRWTLAAWGMIYILCSVILLGIRNILAYVDQNRKRKHHVYSHPKSS